MPKINNIQSCAECKWLPECKCNATIDQFTLNRVCMLVYNGDDCFVEKEEDNNNAED